MCGENAFSGRLFPGGHPPGGMKKEIPRRAPFPSATECPAPLPSAVRTEGDTVGDTEGDTVGDTVGDTWFASRLFFSRGDAGNLSSRRAFVPGAPCPNLGNARLFCALSHGRLPSHSSLLSCAGSAGATACAPCSETIHWDWTRPVSNIGPWKSKELISPPRVHLRNYRTQCVGDHASFKTCVAIRPGKII